MWMHERQVGSYKVLVGRPGGKRQSGRHMHKWNVNIKMDVQKVRWMGADWTDVAQDRDRRRSPVKTGNKIGIA
jgi:hypothetical protein